MTQHLVTWAMDVEADTPREAAEHALRRLRDPSNWCSVFVIDGQQIDLNEPEEAQCASA